MGTLFPASYAGRKLLGNPGGRYHVAFAFATLARSFPAMAGYQFPKVTKTACLGKKEVTLVANGDLRLAANQKCWPAQLEMEKQLGKAVAACGYKVVRAHKFDAEQQHGFISSQREGMEVFADVDPQA